MHLDCSRQPLEGNNQSVFTVQSAGAETSSTNYSKRAARLCRNVVIRLRQLSVKVSERRCGSHYCAQINGSDSDKQENSNKCPFGLSDVTVLLLF